MLSLILAASVGQYGCSTGYVRTSYVRSYAAPTVTYGAVHQYAAPTYAAPAYDPAAVVGEYLRNEFAQAEAARARTEVTSRLDRLETLFKSQSQYQPPVQQQQFQAPYQQPQYQAPYQQPQYQASPQSPPQVFQAPAPPPKTPPPKSPPNPSAQFPTGYAPDPPPFTSQAPPVAQPSSSPVGGYGVAGTGASGSSDAAVTSIIQARCASCHAAPATKAAGLVLLNADGTLAPMSPALMLAVQEDVKTGRMPKGGPEVNDSELSVISSWVGDHAAEITAFLAGGLGTQR